MAKYFPIQVNLIVDADTLEEAQEIVALFMPWTTSGSEWTLDGHKHIDEPWRIDQWNIEGVDSDEMEARLVGYGYR